jgi:hypothetical protein
MGRGQFLSEDPVFLGIGDQNSVRQLTQSDQSKFLTDPQQLNSYSYARNNPIVNKDPNGTCPQCYLAIIGGVAGGLRTYASDVLQNRAQGMNGWAAYVPNTPLGVYGTNILFGAATTAVAPQSLLTAGGLAFLGSAAGDIAARHKVNMVSGLLDAGVTIGTAGFLKWGTGGSLFEKSISAGEEISSNVLKQGLRYSTVQETFTSSVSVLGQNYISRQAAMFNSISGIQNAFIATNSAQQEAVHSVVQAFSK